ncbi:MAG: hypothetical protein IKM16_04850 [Clostridia bacterium]|nr:hypothetical protein [Clostridia bacterium]
MTDKAKRIISIVIVSIILISSAVLIISCNAVKEYEYKYLEDAYEAGWITEDDLKTIADYWNNDDRTLPEMQYSQNVVNNIKYTKFKAIHNHLDSLELKRIFFKDKKNMRIGYYGTYNGYVVATVSGKYSYVIVDPYIHAEKIIGGVSFYNYMTLTVYDINS